MEKYSGTAPGSSAPLASSAFRLALRSAQHTLKKRRRVAKTVHRAYQQLFRRQSALQEVYQDTATLLRFLRAWSEGAYRQMPWSALLLSLAAVLYFLNPLDVIPDMFAVIGYTDDVVVIVTVVNAIRKELRAFEAWEAEHAAGLSAEPDLKRLPPAP